MLELTDAKLEHVTVVNVYIYLLRLVYRNSNMFFPKLLMILHG